MLTLEGVAEAQNAIAKINLVQPSLSEVVVYRGEDFNSIVQRGNLVAVCRHEWSEAVAFLVNNAEDLLKIAEVALMANISIGKDDNRDK